MGWNENIKRILDFIPAFERDVKLVGELSSQLADSVNQCKEAIEQSRLLLEQNEALTKRVSDLESKKVEAYNDAEIKASIEQFSGMFDSFRRVEGESSATAIAALGKKVKAVESSLGDVKPFDDSHLVKAIDEIKPYDDSKLKKLIASIKPYDDSRVKRQIKELEHAIGKVKPYDDSALKLSVKGLSKSLSDIKPYDDAQIKSDVKKAIKAISEIKPFNDSQLEKSIKSLELGLSAVKPYDDKKIKKLVSDLEKSAVKMIGDHKASIEKSDKAKSDALSKKLQQIEQSITKLSKQIPASYDDKVINDRIKKQGDALAELAAEVSKIKQLFEV